MYFYQQSKKINFFKKVFFGPNSINFKNEIILQSASIVAVALGFQAWSSRSAQPRNCLNTDFPEHGLTMYIVNVMATALSSLACLYRAAMPISFCKNVYWWKISFWL